MYKLLRWLVPASPPLIAVSKLVPLLQLADGQCVRMPGASAAKNSKWSAALQGTCSTSPYIAIVLYVTSLHETRS